MSLYCYSQFSKDSTLQHLVQHPLFINFGHKTLKKALVKVQLHPTTEQLFDMLTELPSESTEDKDLNNTAEGFLYPHLL